MKAFVVGRHAPKGLDKAFAIVGQENILFPEEPQHVLNTLWEIGEKAKAAGADVVAFQNAPTPLAAVLWWHALTDVPLGALDKLSIALVIAKPAPGGTVQERRIHIGDGDAAEAAAAAILVANPRAKVHTSGGDVVITVDPPRTFEVARIDLFRHLYGHTYVIDVWTPEGGWK